MTSGKCSEDTLCFVAEEDFRLFASHDVEPEDTEEPARYEPWPSLESLSPLTTDVGPITFPVRAAGLPSPPSTLRWTWRQGKPQSGTVFSGESSGSREVRHSSASIANGGVYLGDLVWLHS